MYGSTLKAWRNPKPVVDSQTEPSSQYAGSVFEEVDVWVRGNGEVYRYRCFRRLSDGRYCVQSMDVLRPGGDPATVRLLADDQFVELLTEADPTVRSPTFSSLPEAIEAHNAEFGNSNSR